MLASFFSFLWRSRKWIWRLGTGSGRISCRPVLKPRSRRKFTPFFEQLEARVTPSAVLITASYFQRAIYEVDAATGNPIAPLVLPGSSSLLQGPSGLALGADGDLYISDYPTNSILQYNPFTNNLVSFISPSSFQTAAGRSGAGPVGLQFGPDGNLYVINVTSQQVLRFNVTNAGGTLTYNGNSAIVASGLDPGGMTFGIAPGDTNNLYVSSINPNATGVLKITNATSTQPTTSAFFGLFKGFHVPSFAGLTWGPDENLYAGELYNPETINFGTQYYHVLQISSDGSSSSLFDKPITGQSVFSYELPNNLVFDNSGHLLVGVGPSPINFSISPSSGAIYQYSSKGAYNSAISLSPSAMILTPKPLGSQIALGVSTNHITAGGTLDVTLSAEDSQNNPVPTYIDTVKLTSTDSQAIFNGKSLPATYTFTVADAGVHTFTITLPSAGNQTITATDSADTLAATTGSITVDPGPFSKYVVAVQGGNTVTAGSPFLFSVQAVDTYGNPLSSYNGPGSVTTTVSPADPLGNFPVSGTLQNSNQGSGIFQGDLQTAGSYTLTTTGGGFFGTSGVITVVPASATYFSVAAPANAAPGNPFNITVTAFDQYGNFTPAFADNVVLTSTDAAANLVSFFMVGKYFPSVTLVSPGNQTITATDLTNPTITGTSNPISVLGLTVTALTPTPTGFTASFSKAFIPNDLTLYGANKTTVQDVTLVGTHVGPIHGSLIIDPSNMIVTFKATASYLLELNALAQSGTVSAVLPDDTYKVTLVSGAGNNGFEDAFRAHLDGANNAGHADFTTAFTTQYQAAATPVLGVPDFARGPDSNTPIEVPNIYASGIPITLYNAAGVTEVTFSLTYNPVLLSLGAYGGAGSDATDQNHAKLIFVSNTGGVATFHYTDPNPISATPTSPLVLGDITAVVPSGPGAAALSVYQVKELLQLGNIVINGNANTGAVSANGIHVNAYFGDVNGDKVISGLDTLTANTVAQGQAAGFSAYTQLDPVIIGDVAGDNSIDAGDVSTIDSFVAMLHPLQIPQPPTQLLPTDPNYLNPNTIHSSNAADPTLSLTRGLTALGSPVVSVMIDHPDPGGSTGLTSVTLALAYDPALLSVTPADITLGSIPGQGTGWQISSVVDQSTGQIGIQLYSLRPITVNQAGSLIHVAFYVLPDATVPSTFVQLVDTLTPNGQWFGTSVADSQGAMILSPGVDQLVLPTGSDIVSAVTVNRPSTIETTDQSHHQLLINALSENDTEETQGTTPLLVDSEGREESKPIIANASFGFPTNAATQSFGQLFQIGNLPLLNSFLYRNSPGELTADRLFLALANSANTPINLGLENPFFSGLIWDAAPGLDWLAAQRVPSGSWAM